MTQVNIGHLRDIAEIEFADIVKATIIPGVNELRIILYDESFVDVWFSLQLLKRYSYHWERRALDGTIYRHDNAQHKRWQSIGTYPCHFHDSDELNVTESKISDNPPQALREFLTFVRRKIGPTK